MVDPASFTALTLGKGDLLAVSTAAVPASASSVVGAAGPTPASPTQLSMPGGAGPDAMATAAATAAVGAAGKPTPKKSKRGVTVVGPIIIYQLTEEEMEEDLDRMGRSAVVVPARKPYGKPRPAPPAMRPKTSLPTGPAPVLPSPASLLALPPANRAVPSHGTAPLASLGAALVKGAAGPKRPGPGGSKPGMLKRRPPTSTSAEAIKHVPGAAKTVKRRPTPTLAALGVPGSSGSTAMAASAPFGGPAPLTGTALAAS
jgi:hypothetical protein